MNIEDLKGCFANITDDEMLRENGLLYAENKELKSEIEISNNIINKLEKWINDEIYRHEEVYKPNNPIFIENGELHKVLDKLKELKEKE